jgi:hypothetical protein
MAAHEIPLYQTRTPSRRSSGKIGCPLWVGESLMHFDGARAAHAAGTDFFRISLKVGKGPESTSSRVPVDQVLGDVGGPTPHSLVRVSDSYEHPPRATILAGSEQYQRERSRRRANGRSGRG